ncbi:MAG: phage/plasmid primase, P4 family [Lachnospiraceae bacterium]|nr:phage/plasmid primase, P4 family [Lachnospiraceae bacterium]
MMKFKSDGKESENAIVQSDIDELDEIAGYDPNPAPIPDYKPPKVGRFSHSEFGDELIAEHHIITLNGKIYIYDDRYYKQDTDRIIEKKMIEIYPDIKRQQRAEVLDYTRIKTLVNPEDIKSNPYIINVENTRLDLKTGKMLKFTPEAIEFDRIPVSYDPTAYSRDLDKMLNKVFRQDQEIRALFEEMVGYCLIKHCKYEKGFLFTGSGSNGKSTILELIKTFLGSQNYSSLELDKVTAQFKTSLLENKLANIGDDINSKALSDTGTLKKLFSGQSLVAENKGKDPFTLRSHAKHIYSCNEIPRSYDKTDGFYRRWVMIPFNAKFSEKDPDFDPLIGEKITTPTALSYLLNMAIEGAQRLIRKGQFTKPQIVTEALENYKINNSLVLSWISENELDRDGLTQKPRDELYLNFEGWCRISNIKDYPDKRRFDREIMDQYNVTKKQKRISGDSDKRALFYEKT